MVSHFVVKITQKYHLCYEFDDDAPSMMNMNDIANLSRWVKTQVRSLPNVVKHHPGGRPTNKISIEAKVIEAL